MTENDEFRAALRESERQLASEIAGARTLQAISTRLIAESTEASLFAQLLDAAMELMHADAASVQMLAEDRESLTLLGWRNFHPQSAEFWQRVAAGAGSACGLALRDNVRVVVADVEACAFIAGSPDLEEFRRSGLVAVQSTPLRSRLGQPLGMISTHWRTPHTPAEADFRLFDVLARQAADLIERTRAEQALRENEERLRLFASTAPVMFWMADVNKACTFVNEMWVELTGQSVDAARGRGWTDRIHPADVEACWGVFSEAFDRREQFQMMFRLRARDGEYRWIVSNGAPSYQADGLFAGYIGSAMDVTERRLAEEALGTIRQRLADVQEEERSRIARELHDDIAQRVTSLAIHLDILARMDSQAAADRQQQITTLREEAKTLARDLQGLSHRLHPARLEYLGIAAAAAALCRDLSEQCGLEISFNAERVPGNLSRGVAICLYRVLQEALQNAIKHSGSRQIDASLRGGHDQIELTVRDDGHGFDVAGTSGRGLGLTSMNERAKAVFGRMRIVSEPQRGTTIHVTVPVDPADAEPAN